MLHVLGSLFCVRLERLTTPEPDSPLDPNWLLVVAWFTTASRAGRNVSPVTRVVDIDSSSSELGVEPDSLLDSSPDPVLEPALTWLFCGSASVCLEDNLSP